MSCDPELECPQPRCQRSDVFPNSPIIATLSGNMDSIINIGDTFKIHIKIPEVLKTNYGDLDIKNIRAGSFFYINYSGWQNFIDDIDQLSLFLDMKVVKGIGPQVNQNYQQMGWDLLSREYEAYFIPTKKGKYLFQLKDSRTEVATKDNKEWLVNLNIRFQDGLPFRVSQYKDFIKTDSLRNQITPAIMERNRGYWYWFEVK
jgi:hypothetical protein